MTDTLTFDKIRAVMDSLPPMPATPFFASSRYLMSDKALKFTHEGREYVGAHPAFWAKIPVGASVDPMAAIPIYDVDVDGDRRKQFYRAMADIMREAEEKRTRVAFLGYTGP